VSSSRSGCRGHTYSVPSGFTIDEGETVAVARHIGIKAGIRFACETDGVVWNNDDDAIIMRMHVAEAVINHPATDGTLQQLGARQLV